MNQFGPYTILGVGKNATKAEIRAAYRKLAKEHHPDKGGKVEAFQAIQHAYDILGDDLKRLSYDRLGAETSIPQEDADSIARRELVTIFMTIVQNCDYATVDFKREIQRIINERKNIQTKGITDARIAIGNLNRAVKRLYCKKKPSTKTDYFRAALDDTIVKMHQGIARCEELLELLKRMEEILESDYDFVPVEPFNPDDQYANYLLAPSLRGSR